MDRLGVSWVNASIALHDTLKRPGDRTPQLLDIAHLRRSLASFPKFVLERGDSSFQALRLHALDRTTGLATCASRPLAEPCAKRHRDGNLAMHVLDARDLNLRVSNVAKQLVVPLQRTSRFLQLLRRDESLQQFELRKQPPRLHPRPMNRPLCDLLPATLVPLEMVP
jgi:hypothetical protein